MEWMLRHYIIPPFLKRRLGTYFLEKFKSSSCRNMQKFAEVGNPIARECNKKTD